MVSVTCASAPARPAITALPAWSMRTRSKRGGTSACGASTGASGTSWSASSAPTLSDRSGAGSAGASARAVSGAAVSGAAASGGRGVSTAVITAADDAAASASSGGASRSITKATAPANTATPSAAAPAMEAYAYPCSRLCSGLFIVVPSPSPEGPGRCGAPSRSPPPDLLEGCVDCPYQDPDSLPKRKGPRCKSLSVCVYCGARPGPTRPGWRRRPNLAPRWRRAGIRLVLWRGRRRPDGGGGPVGAGGRRADLRRNPRASDRLGGRQARPDDLRDHRDDARAQEGHVHETPTLWWCCRAAPARSTSCSSADLAPAGAA